MIYFHSKHLAEKLNINLARWKRWSREFLPPDPLGGLRSGYARQFSYREAFTVYLGGHLVGQMNLSIAQSVQVLSDLEPWLKSQGYFALPGDQRRMDETLNHVYMFSLNNGRLGFEIRTYTPGGMDASGEYGTEKYLKTLINMAAGEKTLPPPTHSWVLFIDNLHRTFLERLSGSPTVQR